MLQQQTGGYHFLMKSRHCNKKGRGEDGDKQKEKPDPPDESGNRITVDNNLRLPA